jgi:hypothetical protein
MGRYPEALTHYRSTAALSTERGLRDLQARALDGIARIQQATGFPDEARDLWREALAIYTELDMPQARHVRGRLTTVDRAHG